MIRKHKRNKYPCSTKKAKECQKAVGHKVLLSELLQAAIFHVVLGKKQHVQMFVGHKDLVSRLKINLRRTLQFFTFSFYR